MDRAALSDLEAQLTVLDQHLRAWIDEGPLPFDVPEGIAELRRLLGNPFDVVHRVVQGGGGAAHLCYFDRAVNEELILEGIVQPLRQAGSTPWSEKLLTIGSVKALTSVSAALKALGEGSVVIGFPADGSWWAADAAKPPLRPISEPKNAEVIHGPHQGFIEDLVTNIYLLRQYLHTPFLRVHRLEVGTVSHTTVAVVHVEGISKAAVVRLAVMKLRRLSVDGVVDSSQVAETLAAHGILPASQYSERPDQVVGSLMEGRVAILVQGSPSALLIPATLAHLMSRSGDYYQLASSATVTRILRYLGLLVAIFLPALYVGLYSVNPVFVPLPLLLSTVHGRLMIPFPILVETIIMVGAMDFVEQAGLTMPGALGQTVTIIGALVVGEAAIRAGMVSAPTLIVAAVAIIGQLMIPDANLANSARLFRWMMFLPGTVFGLTGIVIGALGLLAYGANLRSFGMPYLTPFAPLRPKGLRDSILRLSFRQLGQRPRTSSQRRTR